MVYRYIMVSLSDIVRNGVAGCYKCSPVPDWQLWLDTPAAVSHKNFKTVPTTNHHLVRRGELNMKWGSSTHIFVMHQYEDWHKCNLIAVSTAMENGDPITFCITRAQSFQRSHTTHSIRIISAISYYFHVKHFHYFLFRELLLHIRVEFSGISKTFSDSVQL